MMESEFAPTHLMLGNFFLTSINIRWDNITHITLRDINAEAYLDVLERATGLEYYNISIHSRCKIRMPILHPRPVRSVCQDPIISNTSWGQPPFLLSKNGHMICVLKASPTSPRSSHVILV
jgi:hypothetical protein